MNCGDIKELAPLWHSGELDSERGAEFDAHAGGCAACAAELREQETLDEHLRAIVAAEPANTRAIEERVRRRIARGKIQRWAIPGLAAAAALIAARIQSNRGDTRRAMSLLRRGWRATSHPHLATLYANAQTGASAVERLKRVRELIDLPPPNRPTPDSFWRMRSIARLPPISRTSSSRERLA